MKTNKLAVFRRVPNLFNIQNSDIKKFAEKRNFQLLLLLLCRKKLLTDLLKVQIYCSIPPERRYKLIIILQQNFHGEFQLRKLASKWPLKTKNLRKNAK